MKKTIFLLLVFLSFFTHGQDKKLLKNAVKYLNASKKIQNYCVSDSIVFIEYSNLFDALKGIEGNEKRLLDSLIELDGKRNFSPYKVYFLKNRLNRSINNSVNLSEIVYFSRPYKNTLLVQIVPFKKNIGYSYSLQTKQNNSTLLILYLSRKKKVVYSKEINLSYY